MTSAYFVIWWKLWSLEEIKKKKSPLAVGQDSYVDGRRELSKRKSHPHCIHEGSGKQLLSRGSLFLFPAIAQFVQIKERPRSFHVRINARSLCWCTLPGTPASGATPSCSAYEPAPCECACEAAAHVATPGSEPTDGRLTALFIPLCHSAFQREKNK